MPTGVRAWWRYSRLGGLHTASVAAAVACLVVADLTTDLDRFGYDFMIACTVVAVAGLIAIVVIGAVNAERARRHGCW